MHRASRAGLVLLLTLGMPALAAETPKRGGTLTFMIPADAPPSFDGHRENTFATLHGVAPFYSVLIRVNPDNPASTTDFAAMSAPKSRSRRTAAAPTRFRSGPTSGFRTDRP